MACGSTAARFDNTMSFRRAASQTSAAVFALVILIATSCTRQAQPAADRPLTWAEPVAITHLPNLHRVAPTVWRGAQPTAAGMVELERLGVRTVISLRAFHSDRDELQGTGLAYERISFKTWHPEDEDVIRFLRIVGNPDRHPVFIHCLHGSDRTGTMCAIYRMAIEDWPREDAIREMVEGDYGYHVIWTNLIRYLRAVDIDRLCAEAGLSRN